MRVTNWRKIAAVITGAGSGIGQATALAYARKGATLGLVDIDPGVERVADLAREEGSTVYVFKNDVRDLSFTKQVFADMEELSGGPVRVCVPAAGITGDRLAVKLDKTTHELDIFPFELFRKVTSIDLDAPIYWIVSMMGSVVKWRDKMGLGRWKASEGEQGVAFPICSVVALTSNPGQLPYSAAKAGLEASALTLQYESMTRGFGIRIVPVFPGFTDTAMTRKMARDPKDLAMIKATLMLSALGRFLEPREIAEPIVFATEQEAINELHLTGGWHPSVMLPAESVELPDWKFEEPPVGAAKGNGNGNGNGQQESHLALEETAKVS